jgi:hypothetical protein
MTRQVLFNGAALIRAGGATKVDASGFQNVGLSGLGIVGLVGEADGGLPNSPKTFTSSQEMVQYFRSGPLADAADLVFRPMSDVRINAGAQLVVCIKANQSLASTLSLPAGEAVQILATSIDAGAHTNKISTQISTVSGGTVVQNIFQDGSNSVTETSPPLGATPDFMIQYVGTGSEATMTIDGTSLATTVTGVTSDDLNLPFASYPAISDILAAIQAHPAYAVTAVFGNVYAVPSSGMDWQDGVSILSAAVGITSKLYRIINWVNTNSSIVKFAYADTATGVPPDDTTMTIGTGTVPTALPYTGGVRGISTNTNWQTAFDAMGAQRVNQMVPLISDDLTSQGFGSTATFASVVAAADAYAAYYSSTAGKNEVQNYVGMHGTKTALLAQAAILQSYHTLLIGQQVTRPNAQGNIITFDEWGMAVIMAGARAGADQGLPLVYKTIRCNGITQDPSWTPTNDGSSLILGGLVFAFLSPNAGYRFDRVTTTYTAADNDALTEESVVTNWKQISYDLRSQLESIFVGSKGTPATIQAIYDATQNILEKERQDGNIVDSTESDGTRLKAYRNVSVTLSGDTCNVSATISPVDGVNFILNTLFLVPATISA